ncbi:MAG: hypothetical protein ACYC6L_16650, partial [Anaerolineae bacterium]
STMAIAKEFATAVYVKGDAKEAMSLVVPLTGYGYVTQDAVQSTILSNTQKHCSVDPATVMVGPTSNDFKLKAVTSADTARGIEDRAAWTVGFSAKCQDTTSSYSGDIRIILEKVNGSWGVASSTF